MIFFTFIHLHHPQVNEWCNNIVTHCLKELQALSRPFKYIITCIIMQKNGAGLNTSNSMFWDAGKDGFCKVPWQVTYSYTHTCAYTYAYSCIYLHYYILSFNIIYVDKLRWECVEYRYVEISYRKIDDLYYICYYEYIKVYLLLFYRTTCLHLCTVSIYFIYLLIFIICYISFPLISLYLSIYLSPERYYALYRDHLWHLREYR